MMENLPAIVEAASKALNGANLTILNGTQGVNEVVAGLVGQGLTILETLRQTAPTSAITGANGSGGDTNRDKYGQFSQ